MRNRILATIDRILTDIKINKARTGKNWILDQKLNYIFTIVLINGETV